MPRVSAVQNVQLVGGAVFALNQPGLISLSVQIPVSVRFVVLRGSLNGSVSDIAVSIRTSSWAGMTAVHSVSLIWASTFYLALFCIVVTCSLVDLVVTKMKVTTCTPLPSLWPPECLQVCLCKDPCRLTHACTHHSHLFIAKCSK